uniref:Cellular communication network factor 6 n=1 Tax=Callorhinchus milii TaxID=7868 RepID=A0A4W3H922_CALMI
ATSCAQQYPTNSHGVSDQFYLGDCWPLQLCTVFCRLNDGKLTSEVKLAEFEDPPERRQFCKWPCKCSNKPICSAGASLVTDGCGCCKACAKQVGELCTEADTCDPHKDLYCDYSRDRPRYEFGVCAYTIGVACELNEAFYHHGQTFQPNCYYKCTCLNGAIGCTPTCTKKLAAGQCRNPKNVKRSGYCCEKSFCDKAPGNNQQLTAYRTRPGTLCQASFGTSGSWANTAPLILKGSAVGEVSGYGRKGKTQNCKLIFNA